MGTESRLYDPYFFAQNQRFFINLTALSILYRLINLD
jgi:hypothetical protein